MPFCSKPSVIRLFNNTPILAFNFLIFFSGNFRIHNKIHNLDCRFVEDDSATIIFLVMCDTYVLCCYW